jgi:ferredoxin
MSHVITSACAGMCAAACVDECPVECIAGPVPLATLRAVAPAERAARFPGVQLFIDPERCIDCAACVPVCPEAAIVPERDLPPAEEAAAARNAAFFAISPR